MRGGACVTNASVDLETYFGCAMPESVEFNHHPLQLQKEG